MHTIQFTAHTNCVSSAINAFNIAVTDKNSGIVLESFTEASTVATTQGITLTPAPVGGLPRIAVDENTIAQDVRVAFESYETACGVATVKEFTDVNQAVIATGGKFKDSFVNPTMVDFDIEIVNGVMTTSAGDTFTGTPQTAPWQSPGAVTRMALEVLSWNTPTAFNGGLLVRCGFTEQATINPVAFAPNFGDDYWTFDHRQTGDVRVSTSDMSPQTTGVLELPAQGNCFGLEHDTDVDWVKWWGDDFPVSGNPQLGSPSFKGFLAVFLGANGGANSNGSASFRIYYE